MVSDPAVFVRDLRVRLAGREVLRGIDLSVAPNEILAIVGPAQSGKTTLMRVLNRTLEFDSSAAVSGVVQVFGQDVAGVSDVHALRRTVGIVAPLPVGLPMSVFDNVAFAPRMAGLRSRSELEPLVERCLRDAALWDEVKDRLGELGTRLSGGQQQRLAIARALSHQPRILCLDEFSIAIDPVTTMRIEDVLRHLQREITILLVTNLTQQARRLAGRTMFLLAGEVVEIGPTAALFSGGAADPRTSAYLKGQFG